MHTSRYQSTKNAILRQQQECKGVYGAFGSSANLHRNNDDPTPIIEGGTNRLYENLGEGCRQKPRRRGC